MQYKSKKRYPYLLISSNTHYNLTGMASKSLKRISPDPSAVTASKDRDIVQTELSAAERKRVDDIVLRYQRYVPIRNEKRNERQRSDVSDLEIIRAALLHLEHVDDESLHALILKARQRL